MTNQPTIAQKSKAEIEDWWTKYRIYGPVIGIILGLIASLIFWVLVNPEKPFLNRGVLMLLAAIAFLSFEQHAYARGNEHLEKRYWFLLTSTLWAGRLSLALVVLGLPFVEL